MSPTADDRAALQRLIERYNAAWNDHDVEAIVGMHASGMVFENHTAGDRAVGDEVESHIGGILARWPDMRFASRRLHVHEGLVVSEWTATATEPGSGRRLEWDGVDLFEFDGGLITRKGVYSGSGRPRVNSD